MLLLLFLIFTLVPLVELYLLIRLGTYIGALDTIAIVVFTGIAGGVLAKSQGLAVLRQIQIQIREGRIPAESLFDGLLILISGTMLITPGLLTDSLGFFFLIPWTRKAFKIWLKRKIQEKVAHGEIEIHSPDRSTGPKN